MLALQSVRRKYITVAFATAVVGFLIAWPLGAAGQDKKDATTDPKPVHPATAGADANKELVQAIKMLQAKVTLLEAAIAKIAPPASGAAMLGMAASPDKPAGGMGMGMMDGMMGGMGDKKKPMAVMKDDAMAGMPAMKDDAMGGMSGGSGGMMNMMDDMDMMGMGSMGGAKGKKMKMAAALPGFPGASHIYHIGASDFFLDHPEHITLTLEQKTKLGQMKQKATTAKASAHRKIEEAEQQLWELTGSDQPDATKMDAKVREIEKLRGDQRMAFIQSVGEAAQMLTDEQRKILVGQAQPATMAMPATTAPHVTPKTP